MDAKPGTTGPYPMPVLWAVFFVAFAASVISGYGCEHLPPRLPWVLLGVTAIIMAILAYLVAVVARRAYEALSEAGHEWMDEYQLLEEFCSLFPTLPADVYDSLVEAAGTKLFAQQNRDALDHLLELGHISEGEYKLSLVHADIQLQYATEGFDHIYQVVMKRGFQVGDSWEYYLEGQPRGQ